MNFRWFSFSPEDGWMPCSEREALILKSMLDNDPGDLEGCKIMKVADPINLAIVARMKRPSLIIHPNALKRQDVAEAMAELLAQFPKIELRTNQYLDVEQIVVIDVGYFDSMPNFVADFWRGKF